MKLMQKSLSKIVGRRVGRTCFLSKMYEYQWKLFQTPKSAFGTASRAVNQFWTN